MSCWVLALLRWKPFVMLELHGQLLPQHRRLILSVAFLSSWIYLWLHWKNVSPLPSFLQELHRLDFRWMHTMLERIFPSCCCSFEVSQSMQRWTICKQHSVYFLQYFHLRNVLWIRYKPMYLVLKWLLPLQDWMRRCVSYSGVHLCFYNIRTATFLWVLPFRNGTMLARSK